MADNDSTNGSNLFGSFSAITALVQAFRAVKSGNLGRALLLVGSVLIGRRYPRVGYAIQVADTLNEVRKQYF